LIYNKAAMDNW